MAEKLGKGTAEAERELISSFVSAKIFSASWRTEASLRMEDMMNGKGRVDQALIMKLLAVTSNMKWCS